MDEHIQKTSEPWRTWFYLFRVIDFSERSHCRQKELLEDLEILGKLRDSLSFLSFYFFNYLVDQIYKIVCWHNLNTFLFFFFLFIENLPECFYTKVVVQNSFLIEPVEKAGLIILRNSKVRDDTKFRVSNTLE